MTETNTDIWYCGECELILRGTPKEVADKHFFDRNEPDWWNHWLWGFEKTTGGLAVHTPTGEELHTSDGGGFYHSNFMKPAEVWERLARTRFNLALRRERQ